MMTKATAITCMFLYIGYVLLANRRDHHARKQAALNLTLELGEIEDRHHLTCETYEEGKLALKEYLGHVVFYQERPFSQAKFRGFMFAQSTLYAEMIELVTQLKVRHGWKIAVVHVRDTGFVWIAE